MTSPRPANAAPVASPGIGTLLQGYRADMGHFDELHGCTVTAGATATVRTDAWCRFFEPLASSDAADLTQRMAGVTRQIRDNGITYNVYAEQDGAQRPWSLDLFPLLVDAPTWQRIEAGVLQRMRLLERVMADVYGTQSLVQQGLLPAALVHGHPAYLRALHGVQPVGGRHLHVAAFDLAHGPDGHWWLVGQRTQAPSGLGYLLENRLIIAGQFAPAFEALRVQRLAGTYRALMDSLRAMSPAGEDAHLALLTPGPYNETYFEHAYLARYLGLTLVEGSDLLVRNERLFLKTLKGLVPVHGLLKRVDDPYLDPLELRADSTLGVPGLLQAMRAGNLLVANAPGAGFLESAALLGFLPALSRHLFNEDLSLPALPTWWCGERSAMDEALTRLAECTIRPTYPGSSLHQNFDPVAGARLDPRARDEWIGRIARHPEDYTIQGALPMSQMPTWQGDGASRLQPRPVMLRVFVVSDGRQGWRVLPGGLARIAGRGDEITSMQRGDRSADVWALTETETEVDRSTLLQPHLTPQSLLRRQRLVTSRAAENLYWLGRYTERTENALRLARLTLEGLHGEEPATAALLTWLDRMARGNALVLPGVPELGKAPRAFERALIDSLDQGPGATGVGYSLRALKQAASTVRDRLSPEHWRIITWTDELFFARLGELRGRDGASVQQALEVLRNCGDHMAAITGAQTDRMTRDDGWRLLSIGRHIERLAFLSTALQRALDCHSLDGTTGFEAVLQLFDSAITFHAQYQRSRDMAALVELLVIDRDNPRSLAWVAHTLRGRLAKLAGSQPTQLSTLALRVPNPADWTLAQLCGADGDLLPHEAQRGDAQTLLNAVLRLCSTAAYEVSDAISATYFTHSAMHNRSLGSA